MNNGGGIAVQPQLQNKFAQPQVPNIQEPRNRDLPGVQMLEEPRMLDEPDDNIIGVLKIKDGIFILAVQTTVQTTVHPFNTATER